MTIAIICADGDASPSVCVHTVHANASKRSGAGKYIAGTTRKRARILGPLKNHKLSILLIIYRILPLNHRAYTHFSCFTLARCYYQ